MRVLWVAANKFGYELLKEARHIKGINLVGVFTLSPRAHIVMYDGIKDDRWNRLGLKIYRIEDINRENKLIKKISPHLIVICGWRQRIKGNIISIPKRGIVGFHPTCLPFGRGPAPIINTLLRGERKSGLTMFYLSGGIDNGDIIVQKEFCIRDSDYAQDIYRKIIVAGKKLLIEYLPLVVSGTAPRVPQDESMAVVFRKPLLKENRIDLEKETLEDAYRKIKALSKPYKGAYIQKGNKRLIIWKAELKEIEE